MGVTLDEAFRGRSLAQVFLRDTARLYFLERKSPVLAYIKKTNVASVRAFEQAGYRPAGEEPVKGIPSFVYKLEREDV